MSQYYGWYQILALFILIRKAHQLSSKLGRGWVG